jgi:S1-C subfamily serine protease
VAQAAGLIAGDVIVGVNSHSVADAGELRRLIGNLAPETRIHITLLRDGRQVDRNATVTLKTSEPATYDGAGLLRSVVMAKVESGSAAYGKVQGADVIFVGPDSAAASSGLVEGDIIATVDWKPVEGPEQAVAAAANDQGLLLLGVYRDKQMLFVVIRRRNS